MRKIIPIIFLMILLVISPIYSVNVFITSDNIINTNTDLEILNSIKEHIESIDSSINVNVDENAPGPGEGTRATTSSGDVSIVLAAACAGNFLELANYALKSDKQIIYVNTGNFDIDSENSLRRAWDDNYSNEMFAGIKNPGKFLNNAGISTIQPLKEYPDASSNGVLNGNNDDVNKYIASETISKINSPEISSELDTSLINYHKIKPSVMASSSQELLESETIDSSLKYNSYSPEQLLYLTSTYLGSSGIDNPKEFQVADSPLKYSLFAKGSYNIGEYMEMAKIVKEYMDKEGKAPDYIIYNGAVISYYDLTYNFAKITEDHTDASSMDFDREYSFEKYNESIIIDIIPIFIIIFIVIVIFIIIKKIAR
ncbi:adhesin [Methanobrevibacter sp. DSM 116169]|uniref:adhesin n=1 Tax=Methanobrevibacter sp. DSM 116169 TaxID=3242727 RepID=UPI0038FCA5DD